MKLSKTSPPETRAAPSLGWFVSLSLLLHLTLLWALEGKFPFPIPGSPPQEPESLAIRLQPPMTAVAAKAVASPVKTAPSAVKPVVKKTPQPPAPTPRAQAIAREPEPVIEMMQTAPDDTLKSAATVPHPTESDDNAARQQHLKIVIRQALADNFHYPLLARRRGWQGEVLLAFRIDTDGSILDAHIARSSGYGILDSAALSALSKVKQLAYDAPHGFTMQLPIIYRLES